MSSIDVLGILPEERFECSICREVFSDPVTTPCGHTFCKACIGERWDSSEICRCPKCSKRFHARPEVSTNSLVEEISSQIKRRRVEVNEEPPLHAGEVPCDLCVGRRLRATKSCLVCLAALCETHLKPHHSVSTLTRHQLVEPLANIEEKICQTHQRLLGLYCRDDDMCICPLCTETDHRGHHTVSLEEEAPRQKEKIQTMIRQRKEKMEEVKFNVDLSREKTKKELEDVDELFTSLIDRVKAKHTELKSTMRGKRQEMENKATAMVKELAWEITKLQWRSNELEQLEEKHDPLHLLQCFQTAEKLCTHPPTNTGWSERSHYADSWSPWTRTQPTAGLPCLKVGSVGNAQTDQIL